MISGFQKLVSLQNKIKVFKKPKIFCIGLNKTGTTSLSKAMQEIGYICGNQMQAERLIYAWGLRDYKRIINYCYSAQFFQDIPFSLPYTYMCLDQAFPGSKFILTLRDSPQEWYNSLTSFHGNMWGKDNRIPTKEDLQKSSYHKKGWAWEVNRLVFKTPDTDPYDKTQLIKFYEQHNENVIEYFRHRSEDLLILNVSDDKAYIKLCEFFNINKVEKEFPWENKTYKSR